MGKSVPKKVTWGDEPPSGSRQTNTTPQTRCSDAFRFPKTKKNQPPNPPSLQIQSGRHKKKGFGTLAFGRSDLWSEKTCNQMLPCVDLQTRFYRFTVAPANKMKTCFKLNLAVQHCSTVGPLLQNGSIRFSRDPRFFRICCNQKPRKHHEQIIPLHGVPLVRPKSNKSAKQKHKVFQRQTNLHLLHSPSFSAQHKDGSRIPNQWVKTDLRHSQALSHLK